MEMIESEENNGLQPILQRRIFFGREVGFADRKLLPTFQLKSRTYLGPTAMDAEMAFLMANQAKATSGKLVYDPFVGTGSILVSAARFGAITMVCNCSPQFLDPFLWFLDLKTDKRVLVLGCRY